jgi:tetratricopeptide (TPR) repeat protein
LYAKKGDNDNAIADYTRTIILDPADTSAIQCRDKVYYSKGGYNKSKENYADYLKRCCDKAISDYTELIKLDPNDFISFIKRGNAYYFKKDYDSAIADYSLAIKLATNDVNAYYFRGDAYREKGDYDSAIADYTKVIKLDPNNTAAYINRGVTYDEKGDCENAIADYAQAFLLYFNESGIDETLNDFIPLKFDCILSLDNITIQKIISEADKKQLATALKGEESEIQDKVFMNMPKSEAAMLMEDMEYLGPVLRNDVKEAQGKMLNVIRHLVKRGEIVIGKKGEEI